MQRAGAGGHGIASRSGPRAEFANRPPQMRRHALHNTPRRSSCSAGHATRRPTLITQRAARTDNASRASQPITVTISSHPDAYMNFFALLFGFAYLFFAQGAMGAFSPGLPGIFCTF